MDDLKQSYNKILSRITAGERYIDNNALFGEDLNRLTSGYKALVSHGNKLLKQIRDAGFEVTGKDVLGGFSDEN